MVDSDRGGQTKFGLYLPNETPEYKAAHADWCLALGAFLYQFAEAEHHLRRLLIRYAGVTETIGRALFHSDRVAEMKDAINRILDGTRRTNAKAALEGFFSHLTVITGVRNNIVHWGGHQLESGDYIVSNIHMAPIERTKGHRVGPADLRAMADDLALISAALVVARERTRITGWARFPLPIFEPEAWQYKPRPLPPLVTPRNPQPPPRHKRLRDAWLQIQRREALRPKPKG